MLCARPRSSAVGGRRQGSPLGGLRLLCRRAAVGFGLTSGRLIALCLGNILSRSGPRMVPVNVTTGQIGFLGEVVDRSRVLGIYAAAR